MSYSQPFRRSSSRAPGQLHGGDLKQMIKKLLDEASSNSPDDEFCRRCGRKTEYADVDVVLYGTELKWHVRLPACVCGLKARGATASRLPN